MLFLTATQAAAPAAPNLWELCVNAGFIMIVLGVLALISIVVFVERALVIRKASRSDASFMQRIKDYILSSDVEAAHQLCPGLAAT